MTGVREQCAMSRERHRSEVHAQVVEFMVKLLPACCCVRVVVRSAQVRRDEWRQFCNDCRYARWSPRPNSTTDAL